MADFGELFKYPMRDERWIQKTLVGGIIGMIPVLNFISLGYVLRYIRRTDPASALPEWDGWSELFKTGCWLFVICAIYLLLPNILLSFVADGMGLFRQGGEILWANNRLALLGDFLRIVVGFFLPMAVVNYAANKTLVAAFDFGEIASRIKRTFGDYLITYIILVVCVAAVVKIGSLMPFLSYTLVMLVLFYLWLAFFNTFNKLYHSA